MWSPTPSTHMQPGSRILLLNNTYPFELPPEPKDERLILYHSLPTKEQYFRRGGPPEQWREWKPAKRSEWIESETRRCFETGQWIFVKGQPVWMPPFYWFLLNWWYTRAPERFFDFRISQLLEEYFELFCEEDPWCIGTFSFKKRRDGKTTRRMAKKCWKAIQTENGWFGLQSKTGKDAQNVCWRALMLGYKRLPTFFLPEQAGMSDPQLKIEFKKPSERITKSNRRVIFDDEDVFRTNSFDDELNTTIDWRDTVEDAYDGQQVNEVDLDEFGKWRKASAMAAAHTYIQSCTLDGKKVGMIHCYTSPPEKDGKELGECMEMWDKSNYEKNKDEKAWKFYRWLTSSLDSFGGAIDKYGYCDRDKADEQILAYRKSVVASKRKAAIRQTVRYIEEVFDNVDNDTFVTAPTIRRRKKFLESTDFKNIITREPKYIYGNYEWHNKIPFTTVFFKPSENQEDYSFTGRWAQIYEPGKGSASNMWRERNHKGKIIKLPLLNSEFVMGIDPYDFRRTDSVKPSNGAAAIGKCFDFEGNGKLDVIHALYNFRPDPNIFYMDMVKAAVYFGAWVNAESRNMKVFDFFEDNGYFEYMLMKDVTDPMKKDIKGSPTTTNMIQEICSAIEDLTTDMSEVWHEHIPADFLDFDPSNTKKSNITMCIGHMALGFAKRRKLYRVKQPIENQMSNDLASAIFNLM